MTETQPKLTYTSLNANYTNQLVNYLKVRRNVRNAIRKGNIEKTDVPLDDKVFARPLRLALSPSSNS
jgi:hypothetical protein